MQEICYKFSASSIRISPTTTKYNMEISVVIPVYNEEENIPMLLEQLSLVLNKLEKDYEVIFIDDGSTDNTLKVLKQQRKIFSVLKIVVFDKNYGLSQAIDAGFKYAKGKIIITMDGDLQNDPCDIPKILEKFYQGYDLVTGWRKKRYDSKLKLIASKVANFIRNKLTGENIHDTACTLKAYDAQIAKKIKFFKGMHRFLPTLMRFEGASIIEVPVTHHPRKFGKSKYNIRKRILKPFIDLIAVIWMKKNFLNYRIKEII